MPSIVANKKVKNKNNIKENKTIKNSKRKLADLEPDEEDTDDIQDDIVPKKKIKAQKPIKEKVSKPKAKAPKNRKESPVAKKSKIKENTKSKAIVDSKDSTKPSTTNKKSDTLFSKKGDGKTGKKLISSKNKNKESSKIAINEDMVRKPQNKPIVIDICDNEVINIPDYSDMDIEIYTTNKFKKEDTRTYCTISLFDEKENYTEKITDKYEDIVFDFHSRSIDMRRLMAIDKDNKVKKAVTLKPPIDIDKMKRDVESKADELDNNNVEDFFNDSTFEEYVPLSATPVEKPSDVAKEPEDDTEGESLYESLLKDFETDTTDEEQEKLTFGTTSDEIYIDNTPLVMGNDYSEQIDIDADLVALGNLQIQIEEEDIL